MITLRQCCTEREYRIVYRGNGERGRPVHRLRRQRRRCIRDRGKDHGKPVRDRRAPDPGDHTAGPEEAGLLGPTPHGLDEEAGGVRG